MKLKVSEIIQAQGRGGRDGCPARCYILPSMLPLILNIGQSELYYKGWWYTHDYIYTHGLKCCLHYGSTFYIDGGETKCEANERNQLCCVCKNNAAKESDQPKATTQQHVHALPKSSLYRRTISTNLLLLQQHMHTPTTASPIHRWTTLVNKRSCHQIQKLKTARQAAEMNQVDWMRKALNTMKDKGCTLCCTSHSEGQFHKLSIKISGKYQPSILPCLSTNMVGSEMWPKEGMLKYFDKVSSSELRTPNPELQSSGLGRPGLNIQDSIKLRVTNPEPRMSELRTRYSEQSIEFQVTSPEPPLSTITGVRVL
ncbi:hypothetical protein BDR05DRAFT_950662 [Suillus weaverae]|nr:hypothetical protein BDR05DRAFT_950662 [Suillus weaverae]